MTERAPVRYRITPANPAAHRYDVSCTVADPDPAGQRFALPAWIPGSYMIREYAKHVVSIRASARGRAVALRKLDKHTWLAAPAAGPLTVTMQVYAWDLSVRGAHLDASHGFFNGTCVFLRLPGDDARACEVEIVRPRGTPFRRWRVATAMQPAAVDAAGYGHYRAADYDELIDHPVEMGEFAATKFRACGVEHEVVVTGRHDADLGRLARDLRRVCEHHIRFFGEPAPFRRYTFLVTAVGEGYGGLEHRASTALLCSRNDLPQHGVAKVTDGYRTFLGLASHEYFHTWMVKRIKPAAFTPYDLDRENYTRQLWAFEGITSYYDDLALVRCGLIPEAGYLELLGRTITTLMRSGGRRRQSVAESSFDAWIKLYRPDENSPNAVVSYYTKGALVACALDLEIRSRTRGARSLDHVMRALWKRHGRTGAGVAEDGIERLAAAVAGIDLRRFFRAALEGTGELPLARLLEAHGVRMTLRPAESATDAGGKPSSKPARELAGRATLGIRTAAEGNDLRVTHVLDGGAGQQAGLAGGDALVAIDGLRVTARTLDTVLARRRPGERVRLHAFRRDELLELDATLRGPPADTCVLEPLPGPRPAAARRRWLGVRRAAR